MKRIIFFFILFACAGCQSPDVFSYHQEFENAVWNRFHFIELDVPVKDANQLYDLSIGFTHNDAYPSDHIEVNFTVFFASSGLRSRDYSFRLQDNNRQWTGTKSDEGYSTQLSIIQGMLFPEAGTHRIRIENKMTRYDLPGVVSLDFKMRKAG